MACVTQPYYLYPEIVESSEDDDDKTDSEINDLSDKEIIESDSSEEDESYDGNQEAKEGNQNSQFIWTPYVYYKKVDSFNKKNNGHEYSFEEVFNERVGQWILTL
ncbi:hypothetical protein O181_039605 [Austropuccinia psidii MF-1]|uniref:Uncharacterized protein n=1 Tax=Austropuccinia psidii MF-1 TaxID=1389203 RepID=A0A9Q3DBT8_9BASI|nr:hypothetical protein [Austropuccinia psidii MF-1]